MLLTMRSRSASSSTSRTRVPAWPKSSSLACRARPSMSAPARVVHRVGAAQSACTTRSGTRSRLKCRIFCTTYGVFFGAPSDRSGQQSASARRWQLAPPGAFVVRCSAMEPKLRSSAGASKTVRERLIATRDRSRLGAVERDRVAQRIAVLAQDVTRGVGAVDLKAVVLAAMPLDEPRCRGTSRPCRAVRVIEGRHAGGSFRGCLLSLGRGPLLEGGAFQEPALAAGVPTLALRRTRGGRAHRPTAGRCESRSTRGWIFTIPMRASIRWSWAVGCRSPPRRVRRHDRPRLAESLDARLQKTIESKRGPAATSRRSERRVAFAITPAAERIAVGSARTYCREPPIL